MHCIQKKPDEPATAAVTHPRHVVRHHRLGMWVWWYPGMGWWCRCAYLGATPWYGSGTTPSRVLNGKFGKNKGKPGKISKFSENQ